MPGKRRHRGIAAVLAALMGAVSGSALAAETNAPLAARAAASLDHARLVWSDREEVSIRLAKLADGSERIDEFDKLNAETRINQHLAFLREEALPLLAASLRQHGADVLTTAEGSAPATLTLSYLPTVEAQCATSCRAFVDLTLELARGEPARLVWRRTIRVASPKVWNRTADGPLTAAEETAARASLEEEFVEPVVQEMARSRLIGA